MRDDWLSRDPVGEMSAGGANLYAYVGDDPLNLTDPLGLCWNWPHLPNWVRNHPYLTAGGVVLGGATIACFATGLCELGALGAAGADAAVEAAAADAERVTEGASALYDTSLTRPTSRYLNVQTDVVPAQFPANLEANGYKVVAQTPNATVLSNGASRYSIYSRSSTGGPGAQYWGPANQVVKYSLGPP